MSWEAIGTFALVMVTLAVVNLGSLRWMLERHQGAARHEHARWEEIERALFELRACLPLEYVRREDCLRSTGTLDAKLDALREEIRQEIATLKEKLYV